MCEPELRKKAKENQGKRTDICQNSDESKETKKQLAELADVWNGTPHKAKAILEKTDPCNADDRPGDEILELSVSSMASSERFRVEPFVASFPTRSLLCRLTNCPMLRSTGFVGQLFAPDGQIGHFHFQ